MSMNSALPCGRVDEETGLADALWGGSGCPGYLKAITRAGESRIICAESGHLVWFGDAADLERTLARMRCTRITAMPHSSFGHENCEGCLNGIIRERKTT